MKFVVRKANLNDATNVAILFNLYRVFYQQNSDEIGALKFILERLQKADSEIFIACDDANKILGFTQLYPTFSSQSMQRMWILNDVYVDQNCRKCGVASALIAAANAHAIATASKGLLLCTQNSNLSAQALYKKLGFEPLNDFQWHFLKTKSI